MHTGMPASMPLASNDRMTSKRCANRCSFSDAHCRDMMMPCRSDL
ncbi:MAG TPA: hypothetical protein VK470_05675 [Bacteroidota bacterium]|nr:hypothetical protein [Bacteroidota bacterium]